MESESGNTALALRERRAIYQQAPPPTADRANAAELARLLGQVEPAREHLVDASGSPLHSENNVGPACGGGARRRWPRLRDWAKGGCDSDALAVSANRQDELALLVLRASLLRSRGEVAAGEELLIRYIGRRHGTSPRDAAGIGPLPVPGQSSPKRSRRMGNNATPGSQNAKPT
jgi:hypothetical protein